jgi:shikimate dehydrogenase
VPLAVAPGDFAAVVRGLAKAGFAGANVTLPHKEAALGVCDRLEESARRAGAVNTLVFGDGIIGSNTDGYGFVANLQAHGVDPGRGPALVLGAGGSARAVGAALQDAGAEVAFCNRTAARAEELAAALGARAVPWAARGEALRDFALLVNTTSLGMVGQPALEMDLAGAAAGMAVADIVYAPLETPLLAAARGLGLIAVPGLGMLLHQAVPGFAAWFGVTPVVDEEIYRIVAG